MRSTRGLVGSLAILAAVPAAALSQALAGAGAESVVHGAFAFGCGALAFALGDFGAPRWVNRSGSASVAILAAIFALQGLGELLRDERLLRLAYQGLGQGLEARLVDVFLGWCAVTLIADARSSRIAGAIALAPILCVRAAALFSAARGGSFEQAPALKALLLLPLAWLLFESAKPAARRGSAR